jgi:hypothetical protein
MWFGGRARQTVAHFVRQGLRNRCEVLRSAVEFTTMLNDEQGRELHDRATRGMPLSAQEQAQLEQWYAQQDQCETDTLTRAAPPSDLVRLRREIDGALAQLQGVTQRVQVLAGQNEALKQEIATLQRQLKKNAQPA